MLRTTVLITAFGTLLVHLNVLFIPPHPCLVLSYAGGWQMSYRSGIGGDLTPRESAGGEGHGEDQWKAWSPRADHQYGFGSLAARAF